MQLKQKTHLTLVIFWGDFYEVQEKGTGYVVGTLLEWQKSVPKGEGYLMPFILKKTEYNKVPLPDFPMMNVFISNNQYSKSFKNTYEVIYEISVVDIPESKSMTECEKSFDKNVLPIKK